VKYVPYYIIGQTLLHYQARSFITLSVKLITLSGDITTLAGSD